jgi:hypothetical protein
MYKLIGLIYICYSCSINRGASINKNVSEEVKEGKIVYSSTTWLSHKKIVLYFADFGKKRFINIADSFLNSVQNQIIIEDSSFRYTLLDSVQGIKQKQLKEFNFKNLDFNYLNEKTKKEYGIKMLGEEFFLNKRCKKYSLNYNDSVVTGEFLVYQNIPLKYILKSETAIESVKAISFEASFKFPEGLVSKILSETQMIEVTDVPTLPNN